MKIIRIVVWGILILLEGYGITSGATVSNTDREIWNAFRKYAQQKNLATLPADKRIPVIAEFFLGKPYQSGTLNVTAKELPVINLRELDCVTLVENVLALAMLDSYEEEGMDCFIENIMKIRYRDGVIIDYVSRLHYSSDWLYEMGRQHILTDKTENIGGVEHAVNISYMTAHYTNYPVLAKDRSLLSKMKAIETLVNKRTYYYIPKDKISTVAKKIETGDILLITTNIKGLDTSHLGIAVKKGKNVFLLHASSRLKKVVLTDVPLESYLADNKSQTGIMVGRICSLSEKALLALPD